MPLNITTGAMSAKGFGFSNLIPSITNNSLRFRASVSPSLLRTPSDNSTSTTTRTFSAWVKRGLVSASARYTLFYQGISAATGQMFAIEFNNNTIRVFYNSGLTNALSTTAIFRDTSAWYHIVVASDTTQANASDRTIIYVNGISQVITGTQPTQNYTAVNGNTSISQIGILSTRPFDGYMTEINFVDGQALTPSSFGKNNALTGVWQPKAYTGTYGINGFYLKFSDIALTSGSNTGLGQDFSGNGNYFNTNNISVTAGITYDAMTDVPTLSNIISANYAVLNPNDVDTTATLSNANLAFTTATTGHSAVGSFGMSSGKWYWEAQTSAGTTQARATVLLDVVNGGTPAAYFSFAADNAVYGFRFDADAGNLDYTQNGTSWISIATGLVGLPFFPYFNNNGTTSKTITVNFGQRPFTFTPPAGYKALNTFNLSTPSIKNGNKYIAATTYTGNGSTQNIVNLRNFKPDLVWVKYRNVVESPAIFDSVRGVNKRLFTNSTLEEVTIANTVTAFNSDGFSVGTNYNVNAGSYIGWQWQAGQGITSSNTQGTIASTVSVNQTAGFSIVSYVGTGANGTVGHGLGITPSFVVVKNRTDNPLPATGGNWRVYQAVANTILGGTAASALTLNSTAIPLSSNTFWNNGRFNSTIIPLGTSSDTNQAGNEYIAYCWASIEGFSDSYAYIGNGNANGPLVYLGFKPIWIMIKRYDLDATTSNWVIIDSSRQGYNVNNDPLFANLNAVEGTTDLIDILSTGFKIRSTDASVNANTGTYLYLAFAETPFKYALAR
jgi:hypothetical protein